MEEKDSKHGKQKLPFKISKIVFAFLLTQGKMQLHDLGCERPVDQANMGMSEEQLGGAIKALHVLQQQTTGHVNAHAKTVRLLITTLW